MNTAQNIIFREGVVSIQNIKCFFFPTNYWINFFNILDIYLDEHLDEYLHKNLEKDLYENLNKNLINNSNNKENNQESNKKTNIRTIGEDCIKLHKKSNFLLQSSVIDGKLLSELSFENLILFLNSLGTHKVICKKINSNKILVKFSKKINLKIKKILNHQLNLELEYILLGIIKGYFESKNIFISIQFLEDKYSKSNTNNFIITTKKSSNKLSSSKLSFQKYIFENISPKNTSSNNTPLKNTSYKVKKILKNILIKGNLQIKDSEIFLFKMNGMLFPIYTILSLLPQSSKFEKEFLKLGYEQGVLCTQLHNKKFGIKTNQKIIPNIVNLSDISGLGNFEIISNTFPIKLKFKPSFEELIHKNNQLLQKHIFEIAKGAIEEAYSCTCKIIVHKNIIIYEKIQKNKNQIITHKESSKLNLHTL